MEINLNTVFSAVEPRTTHFLGKKYRKRKPLAYC